AAKVFGLEVVVRAERMDDPHLVTGAAGGDVETLLEKFLVAERKSAALCGIHKGNENHIAFIALELRGIAAEQAVKLVAIGRAMSAKQIVDFDGLLAADQGNYAAADRLSHAILIVP